MRWGFPFVSISVTFVTQAIVPRVLQIELSEAAYTRYVAVTAVAAYVGLADAGVFAAILRELSAYHGAGDRVAFKAEAARGGRVFTAIALLGLVVALVLISSVLTVAPPEGRGASETWFATAAIAYVAANAAHMGSGSFHATMLFATGRLLAGQALTLLASTLPVITLIVALVVTRDVSAGIAATAVATFAIALGRLAHAHAIFSRETKGVARAAAKTSLGSVITTGLALRTAELLPNSAYPHALAVFASGEVPSAIPARTYANACRIVSQQFVNILHVHITRRMAGTDAERRRGLSEYALAARFLCSCQLVLVGLAACAADVVVALWLPNQRDAIQEALPGLLVEQALLSASLPVWISLIAEGRMRLLGGVRLSGALAGLALLIPALLMWPPQALGLACAVSAVPLFVFGALWEGRWATRLQLPWCVVATRYLPALVAALLCAGFRAAPLAIGGVVVLMGAAWLPSSLRGIWGVLRASPAAAGGATKGDSPQASAREL
jgi:hypothetical protein